MIETTVDGFLGGRLSVRQPARGYRAGADPVFLAAAVDARPGDRVLELGCGVGVALLCLLARVPGLVAVGVERAPELAALARENLAANRLEARIVAADIADLPRDLRQERFDHVLANPPYFDRAAGRPSDDPLREAGRGAETPLGSWCDAGLRRLVPRGNLVLIQRAERLDAILAAVAGRAGDIRVQPLAARAGRPARHVIVSARKGAKGPLRLEPPLILHAGARHGDDPEGYTPRARAILRDARGLAGSGLVTR